MPAHIHIIGNGSVSAVYDGASVMQAFGPTYSSPNAFRLDAGDGWTTERLRPGVFRSVRGSVTVTDQAGNDGAPVLLRRIAGHTSMTLTADQPLFPVPAAVLPDSFMSECHAGTPVYLYGFENGIPCGYVSARKRYFGLRLSGSLTLTPGVKAGTFDGKQWTLDGEGCVLFAFSDSPEGLFARLSDVRHDSARAFLPGEDESFDASPLLAKHSPAQRAYAMQILGAYDTIVSQQSASGGVLAGYNYHLCYLRDNYGVYRGLRAMGAHREADALAEYYIGIHARYGCIHNAQGPDEYAFHVHENDDVEITAYFALILCDYLRRNAPAPDAADALNGIRWALTRQHENLTDGMLPFNGDETYVAGGLLSRACLNDGSMEATALYHKALCEAERLAVRYPSFALPAWVGEDRAEIQKNFRRHFYVDGHWVCNCPGLPAAAFRHGVRACGHGFGLAFRNGNGDYVCRDCLNQPLAPIWQGAGQRYAVPAAILCPSFIDSPLIPVRERIQAALSVLDSCETTGCGTGYDLGFVLWTLCEPEAVDDPVIRDRAQTVRRRLLSMADAFGAYSEYYRDGFTTQSGTLCRPWETGINIAALLRSADVL